MQPIHDVLVRTLLSPDRQGEVSRTRRGARGEASRIFNKLFVKPVASSQPACSVPRMIRLLQPAAGSGRTKWGDDGRG